MSILQKYLKVKNADKNLYYNTTRISRSNDYVPIDEILSLGEINHLSDVSLTAVSDKNFLVYKDAVNGNPGYWENLDGADALSAIGVTATIAELNILDIGTASNSNNKTNFLRADGTWAAPTTSGITGLTGDSANNKLIVTDGYDFSFPTNNNSLTLKVEDQLSNNTITFPNDSGEVSLAPVYTNYYLKHISSQDPFEFTKNNESVMLIGSNPGQVGSVEDFYVSLGDESSIASGRNSLNITGTIPHGTPRKGIYYRLSRSAKGKVFIAPYINTDSSDPNYGNYSPARFEVIGNSNVEVDDELIHTFKNIEKGKTYRIISGAGWTSLGSVNDSIGTFFTATINGYIHSTFTGRAMEAIEIKASDFASGWIDIVGMSHDTDPKWYYAISKPSMLLDSPAITGDLDIDGSVTSKEIKVEEPNGSSAITLKAPDLENDYSITLPNVQGVANQVMKSSAEGELSWINISNESSFDNANGTDLVTSQAIKDYVLDQVGKAGNPLLQTTYTFDDNNLLVELNTGAYGKTITINVKTTIANTKVMVLKLPPATNTSYLGSTITLDIISENLASGTGTNTAKHFANSQILVLPSAADPQLWIYRSGQGATPTESKTGIYNFTSENSPQFVTTNSTKSQEAYSLINNYANTANTKVNLPDNEVVTIQHDLFKFHGDANSWHDNTTNVNYAGVFPPYNFIIIPIANAFIKFSGVRNDVTRNITLTKKTGNFTYDGYVSSHRLERNVNVASRDTGNYNNAEGAKTAAGGLYGVKDDFVVGNQYIIKSIGNSDFTRIGASANEVGIKFTATDVGMVYDVSHASSSTVGGLTIGQEYTIKQPGNPSFTTLGAANNIAGTVFTATANGYYAPNIYVNEATGTAYHNSPTGTAKSVNRHNSYNNITNITDIHVWKLI